MTTTGSLSLRSRSLKSRPSRMGMPTVEKNPGVTLRNSARGSSSPGPLVWPSAANRFFVEMVDLVFCLSVRVDRKVNDQDSLCVENRSSVLHVQQSFQQHAGACEEQERSGNLRHGE